jgi:glycosyltransferase involved in cell wall biosynthesis
VRQTCRALRPDVLHGHGSKGGLFARLAVPAHGKRRIVRAYTPHGGSFHYGPGTLQHVLYMAAERVLMRRTDLFLFESEYIAGRFRAYLGETDRLVRIVYNGLAESEFEPIASPPGAADLLHVGELRAGKGIDTLIDAVALLRHERQMRLTLLMVGSGPSEDELHGKAKAAGVWDSMTFMPPQPIRHVLGRGRVMVMPSHAESLPYVILEAAAAARPLVATNVGGIPEIFGPSADELVAPADVRALADAIAGKLAEPEDARNAKAEALRGFVNGRFTIARMVDGVLDAYDAALAAAPSGGVSRARR